MAPFQENLIHKRCARLYVLYVAWFIHDNSQFWISSNNLKWLVTYLMTAWDRFFFSTTETIDQEKQNVQSIPSIQKEVITSQEALLTTSSWVLSLWLAQHPAALPISTSVVIICLLLHIKDTFQSEDVNLLCSYIVSHLVLPTLFSKKIHHLIMSSWSD